jgi:glycosyltransferase involved in cell wall biosynthesis
MERPLVSIVTPVLDRVETIATCLNSVAAQSYRPIEHIVVDGGSTDGTLELIQQHRPSFPFRWISEPDSGMYDAINKGMSIAQGEVLAYLNSDDLYPPWSVEVAVRALEPGVGLIYGDLGVLRVATDGRPARFHLQFYPDFELRHYSYIGTIGQPTAFWRRSLMDEIGLFDTQYHLIADCEYWLRAALRGARLRHVPELMAVQVEHGSTLRATQVGRLSTEFKQLRHAMSAVIEPPSSMRWARLKGSARWRMRNLEFFYAMKAHHPHKWRHFVRSLRGHEVEFAFRDLAVLAPGRWRRRASLFGDGARIFRLLGGGPR